MSSVELTISRGVRLHFDVDISYEGRYIPRILTNKDKIMLHLLNKLKWRIEFPDGNYLDKSMVTFEAVDVEEDVAKALKALIKIRSLTWKEVERMKKLPKGELCRELVLKTFTS